MHNRRRSVFELIEQWRWIDRCIPAVGDRIRDTLEAHGTSLTDIFGIAEIGAATIVAAVGDVHRFRSRGSWFKSRTRHHQPDTLAPPSTPGRADLACHETARPRSDLARGGS